MAKAKKEVGDVAVIEKTPVETINEYARAIRNGEHDTIRPGMPQRFSEAASVGDAIVQGDLVIEIVATPGENAAIPDGYQIEKAAASDASIQLVPGNTSGAKHCLALAELKNSKMWRHKEFVKHAEETMCGPMLKAVKEFSILHPVHGKVTVPKGFTVLVSYQREYEVELKKARRNAD